MLCHEPKTEQPSRAVLAHSRTHAVLLFYDIKASKEALRTSRHSAGFEWAAGAAASKASHSWKPRGLTPWPGLSADICASLACVLRSCACSASALACWHDPSPDPSALQRMGRSSKATAWSWSSGTWQGRRSYARCACACSCMGAPWACSPGMAGTQIRVLPQSHGWMRQHTSSPAHRLMRKRITADRKREDTVSPQHASRLIIL